MMIDFNSLKIDSNTMPVFVYTRLPSVQQLSHFLTQHPQRPLSLVIGLENQTMPMWSPPEHAQNAELNLVQALNHCTRYLHFQSPQFIPRFHDGIDLWFFPNSQLSKLNQYFHQDIHFLDQAVSLAPLPHIKPWFQLPPHALPQHVLVIGAGIAGASTAFELAQRGVSVSVLESATHLAAAASGNHQGLLYAKISPHPTAQTELLYNGYTYTRRLLDQILPHQDGWGGEGVLHLDFNETEQKRHLALSQQTWHQHLFHYLTPQAASQRAGIPIHHAALYWPHGVWVHPRRLVEQLLQHPLIQVHTNCTITQLHHDGNNWHAQSEKRHFSGSHLVFCTGAKQNLPFIQDLPLRFIRGQTTLATSNSFSQQLKTALSAASYIAPAWQNQHCFGASFIHNDTNDEWRQQEDQDNILALSQLSPELAHSFQDHTQRGHTAIRCDSHDHLPVVGALGNAKAMHQIYQKLTADKNYPITTPCPYLPNAYVHTAHGSRGLATAPICAAELAAQICQTGHVLSPQLRQALSPNRLIIRQLTHR